MTRSHSFSGRNGARECFGATYRWPDQWLAGDLSGGVAPPRPALRRQMADLLRRGRRPALGGKRVSDSLRCAIAFVNSPPPERTRGLPTQAVAGVRASAVVGSSHARGSRRAAASVREEQSQTWVCRRRRCSLCLTAAAEDPLRLIDRWGSLPLVTLLRSQSLRGGYGEIIVRVAWRSRRRGR